MYKMSEVQSHPDAATVTDESKLSPSNAQVEDTKPVGEAMKVYGEAGHVTFTPEEGHKVKRKIDFILLPMLCGCYVLSVSISSIHISPLCLC
jgi:hypothetical protein